MITIKEAINGWIVTDRRESSEDYADRVFVFSHDEREYSEVEAFSRVLWELNNLAGPSTSRYCKKRIYIEVKPGDKCEEVKEGEEI